MILKLKIMLQLYQRLYKIFKNYKLVISRYIVNFYLLALWNSSRKRINTHYSLLIVEYRSNGYDIDFYSFFFIFYVYPIIRIHKAFAAPGSVTGIPGVPENITVMFLNPTSVRVSWSTSQVEQVEKYDVSYKPTDARCVLKISMFHTRFSFFSLSFSWSSFACNRGNWRAVWNFQMRDFPDTRNLRM